MLISLGSFDYIINFEYFFLIYIILLLLNYNLYKWMPK